MPAVTFENPTPCIVHFYFPYGIFPIKSWKFHGRFGHILETSLATKGYNVVKLQYPNERRNTTMKLAIKTCTLDMPYEQMLDFCVEQKIAAIEIGTGNWSGAPHCDLDLLVSDKTAREKW